MDLNPTETPWLRPRAWLAAIALPAALALTLGADPALAEPETAAPAAEPGTPASAAAAPGQQDEELVLPDGYGPVSFGATKEQVTAAFPGVALIRDTGTEENLKSTSVPALALMELPGQSVLDFEGCTARFKFVADQLYLVEFDCGADAPVRERLVKRFGEPSQTLGDAVYWLTDDRTVSLNAKSLRFAFIERKLDLALQAALAKALAESRQQP